MDTINDSEYELSPKQQRFIDEYMVDLNATKAAIRAGYSMSSARQIGSENLSKPYIQDAIAEAMEERNKRLKITSDDVLQRLVDIDRIDVIDIFSEDGLLKPVCDWPTAWRRSVASFDVIEVNEPSGHMYGFIKRIILPDKLRNLEMIGRHTDVGSWSRNK